MANTKVWPVSYLLAIMLESCLKCLDMCQAYYTLVVAYAQTYLIYTIPWIANYLTINLLKIINLPYAPSAIRLPARCLVSLPPQLPSLLSGTTMASFSSCINRLAENFTRVE